jgi:hypothetical protein
MHEGHNRGLPTRGESRRPDSNRGPLHYELWAAVCSSHRQSPQAVRYAESARLVRDALRRALEFEGYTVELAADGAEALDRLDSERG